MLRAPTSHPAHHQNGISWRPYLISKGIPEGRHPRGITRTFGHSDWQGIRQQGQGRCRPNTGPRRPQSSRTINGDAKRGVLSRRLGNPGHQGRGSAVGRVLGRRGRMLGAGIGHRVPLSAISRRWKNYFHVGAAPEKNTGVSCSSGAGLYQQTRGAGHNEPRWKPRFTGFRCGSRRVRRRNTGDRRSTRCGTAIIGHER